MCEIYDNIEDYNKNEYSSGSVHSAVEFTSMWM
jgi:hypothetical protein